MPQRQNGIFSIAQHAPFLPTLAKALAQGQLFSDWPQNGAFWLSDITIFVPTQRARLTLVSALSDQFGTALLLPDIRTLGGDAGEEELFLPPYDGVSLPKAQSKLRREMQLAAAIERWTKTAHAPEAVLGPAEILRRAEALGEVIDDFNVAQIELETLAQLEIEDASGHWAASKAFLDFAFSVWPQILQSEARVDASTLRNLKLDRHANSLKQQFGDRPVLVAGSTGSIPATAKLLAAVLDLPRGGLILPGLDVHLSLDQQERLLDSAQNPQGHPQYGLIKLLDGLGVSPQAVTELAEPAQSYRTAILNRAMDLPQDTTDWQSASAALVASAQQEGLLDQFTLIDAKNEGEEAQAVALASVTALHAKKSVGIISPDRNLARRIAAQLARFGVDVDDAAGMPLFQSRAGRLARQILNLCISKLDASDLMALLQNKNVTLGYSRQEIAQMARGLDLSVLRGRPPNTGFGDLVERISNSANGTKETRSTPRLSEDQATELHTLIKKLEAAIAPVLQMLSGDFGPSELVANLAKSLEAMITKSQTEDAKVDAQFSGYPEWREFCAEMSAGAFAAPNLSASAALSAFEGLMSGRVVRTPKTGRPDIDIFGQLEARLQHRDLVILCGLNEGIWPEAADPGPWMGRQMRMMVGLEPPERQHGLAAHDFVMAMGSGEVVLTHAQRLGNAPAEPSRLWQRFCGFLGQDATNSMLLRGSHWRNMAKQMDLPNETKPAARPMPVPDAKHRARSLSFTQVESLIFSPYDIYAKHSLGLKPLDALGQPVSHRERGTALHDVFAQFVMEGHDVNTPDAAKILDDLATKHFALLDSDPDRRDIWLRRFSLSAQKFLDFERARDARVVKRYAEQELSHTFQTQGGEFKLYGRADRIDVMVNGTVEILDFKTGSPPSKIYMKQFMAPQLPLEAYVMSVAGFKGEMPRNASALKFIKIANGPEAFVESDFECAKDIGLMEMAERSFSILQSRIAHFLDRDDVPMVPNLIVKPHQNYAGDFDHLSRRQEWSGIGAQDE